MDAVVIEVPEETRRTSATASATSWGAVFAGAFVIAAVGILLLALGAGFGLSAASPWPGAGASATTIGVAAIIWLIVVQWVSTGIGGYLAGRLRTRWVGLHTDESYFRDTAHGVLAWAVAAAFSMTILAAALGLAGTAATMPSGAAQRGSETNVATAPSAYVVDTLFRTDHPAASAAAQDLRPEATRILATALLPGANVSAPDRSYLTSLIVAHTGVSQAEAQKRVDDAIAKERQAADTARKAARNLSLMIGFSMLIGAFIAGVAAKIGGHHRDDLITT